LGENKYGSWRKIRKFKFLKIKSNKNELVSAWTIKTKQKQKHNRTKKEKAERRMKVTAMTEGQQLKGLIT